MKIQPAVLKLLYESRWTPLEMTFIKDEKVIMHVQRIKGNAVLNIPPYDPEHLPCLCYQLYKLKCTIVKQASMARSPHQTSLKLFISSQVMVQLKQ
jgi:hypothetical protein